MKVLTHAALLCEVVWLGARAFFLRRQTSSAPWPLHLQLRSRIANLSLFCFPFQTHPLPFLAGGVSPSPFAEICSLARLPFSPSSPAQSCCQTSVILAERTSYFFHGWSRFGSCLHTHNGCSGSAPVLGALQNFYRLPMQCQLHGWPAEDGSVWE